MVGEYSVISLIGSKSSEIEYTKNNGKEVRYLEEA